MKMHAMKMTHAERVKCGFSDCSQRDWSRHLTESFCIVINIDQKPFGAYLIHAVQQNSQPLIADSLTLGTVRYGRKHYGVKPSVKESSSSLFIMQPWPDSVDAEESE